MTEKEKEVKLLRLWANAHGRPWDELVKTFADDSLKRAKDWAKAKDAEPTLDELISRAEA